MPKRAKTDDPEWETTPVKKGHKASAKSSIKSGPTDPKEGTSYQPGRVKREGKHGILFGKDCIFCHKEEPIKIKQIKQYTTKFQSDSYTSVVDKARKIDDEDLLRRIDGVDLLAAEAHFHENCRAGYLVKTKKDTVSGYDKARLAHNHALEAVVK